MEVLRELWHATSSIKGYMLKCMILLYTVAPRHNFLLQWSKKKHLSTDTAELNLPNGSRERWAVSGKALCAHMYTFIQVCGVGVGQDSVTSTTLMGQHSTAQAGETHTSGQFLVADSGQWHGPDMGFLLIDSAGWPGSALSPSLYSWRVVCGQMLAQAISQLCSWWYCTTPFQKSQVSFSCHLLAQGLYQGPAFSVVAWDALSTMADRFQPLALAQGKVVMIQWHLPFACLGMKSCSFTHLPPSTSKCEEKLILTNQTNENPGSR